MTNQDSALRKSFKLDEFFLNLNGLLPGEKYKLLYSFYSFGMLLVYIIMIPILGYVEIFLAEPSRRVNMVDKSFVYLEIFVSVFKHWPFITKPARTKRLLNRWNESIFNTAVEIDEHIVQDSIRYRVFVVQIYFLSGVISVSVLLISSIFSFNDRELKLPIWLPDQVSNNTFFYVIANIYIITGYTHAFFGHASTDSLLQTYLLYCATQLRLIKFKLKNIHKYFKKVATSEDSHKTTIEGLPQKKIYDQIVQCIKVYEAVNGYVQEMENMYSVGIFMQLIVVSLIFSICAYNLTNVSSFLYAIYILSFTIPMVITMYAFCYTGALLIEESTSIADAVFKSRWYTFDNKNKKLLLTFIERTKKPIKLKAGKLVDLSLETFVIIMNRSYSLLAVLKNVY
ncbi:unnamed protein product [Phyllotreta striolata]|uniref:Odorant receptor n=1 Tax=Phyllotreta striolata TaxID=444603 RepID=A0A9N9TL27_PHYSR|nr:unnamed protein product [Phyllotreta striolata]